LLFAIGIIGTGLLAVPVLAGSAAYAMTEMFGIASSLDAKPAKARLFYAIIAATTFAGASLQAIGINPIKALYWAAVINGILAVPLMALMMLIVRNPKAMGKLRLSPTLTVLGWSATAVMAASTAVFFAYL
jgi:Mn2+/Fe2+ NRAMP family transporter